MLKFIITTVMCLSLVGCSGGAKGNGKKRPPVPLTQEAILTDYNPVGGYDSHVPVVQYLEYDNINKKVLNVWMFNELINTFSWVTFKASKFGETLIGAMFLNNHLDSDLYLWFQVQLGTTQEVVEYRLNLTILSHSGKISGFETFTIGNSKSSRISVEYKIQ